MPQLSFTPALKRFFPNLKSDRFDGHTVQEVLEHIETQYPTIKDYLVDEEGKLRTHINIFVGERMIEDRVQLSDRVEEKDEILIFQALSGG